MKGGENITVKKLLITGAAAGMLLASAAGAFAYDGSNLFILNKVEDLSNNVNVAANSGKNNLYASGEETLVKNSFISTGAVGVAASLLNQVNSNSFNCGCVLGLLGGDEDSLHVKLINKVEDLSNNLHIWANSGKNNLYALGEGEYDPTVKGSNIQTGVVNASVAVSNFVNTNIFGDAHPQ